MEKLNVLELRSRREGWKDINTLAFPNDKKNLYSIRKKAVDLYIDGMPLKTIESNTGIKPPEIIRLVRRCAETDKSGNQFGYIALIPHKRSLKSKGMMERLFLLYPELEQFLKGNYFGDPKYTLEHNMSVRTLHSKMLKKCSSLGIQNYDYPLSTKDKGYNALYRYIKKQEQERQELGIKRIGKEEKKKYLSTGSGEPISAMPIFPFDTVQIDGHKIDILYSVETENGKGETILMPAMRCWLIAVIDVATRVIVGYSVSAHENYSQFDVLRALSNSIVPHKMIKYPHNSLEYPENGGYASTAIPETEWAVCNNIMLDNAKAHLSELVTDRLANDLGIVLNYGSVATPEVRGIVERFFGTLERQGFHRIPGTTGHGASDVKRKNPEKECVKYEISFSDICELLDYLIAEYNNSAHSSIENQTPLQLMETRIKQAGMMPCIISEKDRETIYKLTHFPIERTLRGGYSTGTKPRISYLGLQYHSCEADLQMSMVGRKVIAEINPDDISHVDLYDSNGTYLTRMVAIGEWGRNPHSLKTRQASMKRSRDNLEKNSAFCPDLSGFEEELREKGKNNRRSRTTMNILKEEKSSLESDDFLTDSKDDVRYPGPKKILQKEQYTEEERKLIDSLSIEEAYERGLI